MIQFPEYEIITEIYSGRNSQIFRAISEKDHSPVIIKLMRKDFPTPEELAKFKMEYELLCLIQNKGVVKAVELLNYHNSLAIVMEDFHGQDLKTILKQGPFPIDQGLKIAIQLCDILGALHGQHIIHKDINPSNIVYNIESGQVKLIDFGISTRFSRQEPAISNPEMIEGTLAYISPEQTGRMNRSIDYRSDYYSFGITLFELLAGVPPFTSRDPITLVYSHMAKKPENLQDINPKVPKVLSRIVQKLLDKNSEDRYQSIHGIKNDLSACMYQWNTYKKISEFPVAQKDFPDRLMIPENVYGREENLSDLLDDFSQVCSGYPKLTLISGPSGVGKTVLVNEIQKPVIENRGYFASGKFDQFRQNIPYNGFISVFNGLLKQIISTQNHDEMKNWQEKFASALGNNAKLITDLVPRLEQVIGPQPEIQKLPSREAVNRFSNTILEFVKVFISKDHPLVLFLDDLQWADTASLDLLIRLIKTSDNNHLYILCAFRDDNVESTHPLNVFQVKLKKEEVPHSKMKVAPFNSQKTTAYIAQVLSMPEEDIKDLGSSIYNRTQGNPFHIKQFLISLDENHLIKFHSKKGAWKWDISDIEKTAATDNAVDFLAGKISGFDSMTKQIIATAACLGTRFDLDILSQVVDLTKTETGSRLWEVQRAGLLSSPDTGIGPGSDLSDINIRYRFAHDRIQQAAYSYIRTQDLAITHLKIGRLLAKLTENGSQNENIFNVVDHYNQGVDLIQDTQEKECLALLNLQAGKKAKSSNAFDSAYEFLKLACLLLKDKSWEDQYDLMFETHTHAMDAAHLNGLYEDMDHFGETIFQKAKHITDSAIAVEIVINSLIARNQTKEAVLYALRFLHNFDVKLPENPGQMQIFSIILKSLIRLSGKNSTNTFKTKKITDPHTLAVVNILSQVLSPAYFSTPELLPFLIGKHIQISVKHGSSPAIGYVIITLGVILCGALRWIDTGYKLGQLGLELSKSHGTSQFKARAMFCFYGFILHWKKHGRSAIDPMLEAYQKALESGDIEHASLCLIFDAYHSYLLGMDLENLDHKFWKCTDLISKMNQERYHLFARIFHQSVQNLLGKSDNEIILKGQVFDEGLVLPELIESSDWSAHHSIYFNKLILCALFNQYAEGIENARKAEKHIETSIGTMNHPIFYFYDSICRLSLYDSSNTDIQPKILKKIKKNRKKLDQWARLSPGNYLHKLCLVRAEIASIDNQFEKAADLYDQAIVLSGKNSFIQEQAFANERAALFYKKRERNTLFRAYIQEAYFLYRKWGAVKKLDQLEQQYEFLDQPLTVSRIETKQSTMPNRSVSSTTYSSAIDLESLFRASRVISGELSLEKLLKKMMKIVMETAGAQLGCLILEDDGRMYLEAEVFEDGNIKVRQHQAIDDQTCAIRPVLNQVIETGEVICFDDEITAGRFLDRNGEPAELPKSLLCLPLIRQDKLIGILHLTNNLARGVFSPDRVEVLKILSSNIAISLQNARLYHEVKASNIILEQKVKERTEELELLARTDPLTRLPNRRSILETIEYEKTRCIREEKKFILVLSDIDNFKWINDSHGHDCGDYVLYHIAEMFRSSLRDQDTVARWGGEEFLFLLPETNKDGGYHIAEKIRKSIENERFTYNDLTLSITMTFGISLFDSSISIDECIKIADKNLYSGKQTGKNKVML